MTQQYSVKIIKLFLFPLVYAAIGIGGLALTVWLLAPSNPLTLSAALAVLTVGYIGWFLAEGRSKLKQLQQERGK
jgi:hypothetical protein